MNDDKRYDDDFDEPLDFVNREDEDWDEAAAEEEDFKDDGFEDDEDAAVAAAAAAPPAMARRVGGTGQKRGGGLILGATAVVVVALAAWIFWPRSTALPDDVGELTSIVTRTDSTAVDAVQPAEVRSSDVNLGAEAPAIVPERSGAATRDATPAPVQRDPVNTRAVPPPPITGEPGPDGKWYIQAGAFGSAENAERLAAELRGRDFRVDTPTTVNSAGKTLTLVRVGYFQTRNETDAWLAKHAEAFRDKPSILHR